MPFDEDETNSSIWFLDHLFHENMQRNSFERSTVSLFFISSSFISYFFLFFLSIHPNQKKKKKNSEGECDWLVQHWPENPCPADIDIDKLFRRYTPNPVLVIIDVQPKDLDILTKALCCHVNQSPKSLISLSLCSALLSALHHRRTTQHTTTLAN